MISIRRIQLGEAGLFKQIRLTALRDSPSAFSTTYESALNRSDESWSEQTDSTAQGSDRATFIAFWGDSPIAITALYRDKERTGVGEVIQVWVAPEHRGKGVAVALMDAVYRWAGENGFQKIILTVKQENTRALKFYLKYGFTFATGVSVDNSADPILEMEVERAHISDTLTRVGEA